MMLDSPAKGGEELVQFLYIRPASIYPHGGEQRKMS